MLSRFPRLASSLAGYRGVSTLITQRLTKVLNFLHHQERVANCVDMNLVNFVKSSDFKLDKTGEVPLIRYVKQTDKHDVEVTFAAQSPFVNVERLLPEAKRFDFQVAVRLGASHKALVFKCSSYKSEWSILNLTYTPHYKTQDTANTKLYHGREIKTLDEYLQGALVSYLDCLGINMDLINHFKAMSLDKEQSLYVKWLGHIRDDVN